MATTRGGKTWIERNRNAAAEKFYRLIIDSIVQSLHISGYPTHCRVFILGDLRYMSFAFRAFAITIMFFYPCYHSFKICVSVLSLSFELFLVFSVFFFNSVRSCAFKGTNPTNVVFFGSFGMFMQCKKPAELGLTMFSSLLI